MKIFALYLKIKITKKPEWFEEFTEKYFEPVNTHVTLIQPRYVEESKIDDLYAKVAEVIKKADIREEDKRVYFNKLVVDRDSDSKYVLMLNSEDNRFISELQKELRSELGDYGEYVDATTKEYETNFRPHITVAVNLDERAKEEAEKYFVSDYSVEGVLEELVLPIVKDQSLEERTNTANHKIFKL